MWRKNKHKRTVFIAIKMIKQNYISVFIMKNFLLSESLIPFRKKYILFNIQIKNNY